MTSLPPMPDQIELAERVLWVLCLSAQTLDFLDILKKVLQKKKKVSNLANTVLCRAN